MTELIFLEMAERMRARPSPKPAPPTTPYPLIVCSLLRTAKLTNPKTVSLRRVPISVPELQPKIKLEDEPEIKAPGFFFIAFVCF